MPFETKNSAFICLRCFGKVKDRKKCVCSEREREEKNWFYKPKIIWKQKCQIMIPWKILQDWEICIVPLEKERKIKRHVLVSVSLQHADVASCQWDRGIDSPHRGAHHFGRRKKGGISHIGARQNSLGIKRKEEYYYKPGVHQITEISQKQRRCWYCMNCTCTVWNLSWKLTVSFERTSTESQV